MSMFDHCLYFNISSLSRQISKIWEDEFGAVGLAPSHGYLLIAILKNPEISHKELGQLLGFDPSTITRFLDKLENQKYLKKSGMRKGTKFRLTSFGKSTCMKIDIIMERLFLRMQKKIGKTDFLKLVQDLEQARKTIKS